MKVIKVILIVLAVVSVIALIFWQFFLREQVDYARVASAYAAKQVCSCRFVADRELDSCLQDFTSDVSMLEIREVEKAGSPAIRASVLAGLVSSTAVHTPPVGCALSR